MQSRQWVSGSWVKWVNKYGCVTWVTGQYLWPTDPWPINRWLGQSNFKNNFNRFWYQTYKTCDFFTVFSRVLVIKNCSISIMCCYMSAAGATRMYKRQTIIIPRKSWVIGHMGQFTDGSDGSWVTKCDPLSAVLWQSALRAFTLGVVFTFDASNGDVRSADVWTMEGPRGANCHGAGVFSSRRSFLFFLPLFRDAFLWVPWKNTA